MKKRFAMSLLLLFCYAGVVFGEDATLEELLRSALFAEQAEQDLAKAEKGYKEILSRFDEERSYAATAMLRLAEMLKGRGENAAADALFAKVLREFADQTAVADVAKERLGGQATIGAPAAGRLEQILAESPDLLKATFKGMTPLERAAGAGEVDVVNYLLKKGAMADGKNPAYRYYERKGKVVASPLGRAVAGGHVAVVDRLIEAGAILDEGLLHMAAANANIAVVKRLLAAGMELDLRYQCEALLNDMLESGASGAMKVKRGVAMTGMRGSDGLQPGWDMTALEIAAHLDFGELTGLLLVDGASAKGRDGEPSTALCYGMDFGDAALVKALIKNGAEVNGSWEKTVFRNSGRSGNTPLVFASRLGNGEIVKVLLEAGAEVDAPARRGNSAIHSALGDAVEILIEAGADVNQAAEAGHTPLAWLGRGEEAEAKARVLIAAGADPNLVPTEGNSPLINAIYNQNLGVVDALIDGGVEVSIGNERGVPIGLAASNWESGEIVERLLEAGADLNQLDPKGRTPLELAVSSLAHESVAALLEAGADPVRTSGEAGGLPPIAALSSGKKTKLYNPSTDRWADVKRVRFGKVVRQLVEAGADPNTVDASGETALQKAARRGDTELVDYLIEKGASVTAGAEPAYLATEGAGALRGKLFIAAQRDNETLADVITVVDGQTGKVLSKVGAFVGEGEELPACPYTFLEAYGFVAGMAVVPGAARIWRVGETEPLAVDLLDIVASRDATTDVPLRWGDMVEFTRERQAKDVDEEASRFLRAALKRRVKFVWEDVGDKAQKDRKVSFSPNLVSNDHRKTWHTERRSGAYVLRANVSGKGALLSVRELGWESGGRSYWPQTWVVKRVDESGVERTMEIALEGGGALNIWPKDGDTVVFRGSEFINPATRSSQPGHVIISGAPQPAARSKSRINGRRVVIPPKPQE